MHACQTEAKALAAVCVREWKGTLTKYHGRCRLCCTSEDEQNGVKGLSWDPGSCRLSVSLLRVCVCVCVLLSGWIEGGVSVSDGIVSKQALLHVNPSGCNIWWSMQTLYMVKTRTNERTRARSRTYTLSDPAATSGSPAGSALIFMWRQRQRAEWQGDVEFLLNNGKRLMWQISHRSGCLSHVCRVTWCLMQFF